MQNDSSDLAQVLHNAAWMWLGYLAALIVIDSFMYANNPRSVLHEYYLYNVAIALAFLGCSYWPWLQKTLNSFYVPLMLVLIAALPITASRLWIPPLQPGPMSNIEGITLRLLPILFIGLVITAWHYPWPAVVLFAIGTAVLEIAILQVMPRPRQPGAANAVFFVAIVRSVSFLVVGYFISRLIRRLKTQQAALAQANAQLMHYASTLESLTISRERNRMGRELHDTLAHTLSGLSVQLETAKAYWDVDPETARDLLEGSLAATRSGLNETRRALKALRASPLDDLGLLLALEGLAHQAAERNSLNLNLSLPNEMPALSPDVEQCLYRVAQEAVENALQHANAHNLTLQLNCDQTGTRLVIQDDGLGFDPTKGERAGHFGLAGMRERAQLAGGELAIDSSPGLGTRIELRIGS